MSILSRIVAVVSFALLCAAPVARAGMATLEGIVKDASGQPLQGAEIRIQGNDAKVGIVHTDFRGHYAYPALESGTYQVTLLVNRVSKASITNVKTETGRTETLNFALQGGAGATPFTKGRHYVWIPASDLSGTHLGKWVEITNDGSKSPNGMRERMNNQGNALVKELWDQHPSQGGGM